MHAVARFIVPLCVVLTMWSTWAQGNELNELATQAMELSGTRETLLNLGKSLDMQLATDPRVKKMDKKQRAELKAILKGTFDGRRMADELTAALAATNDSSRLRESVSAMRDPMFQKITKQVVRESIKATDDAVAKYAKGFEKRPPDPERVRLIQRLDAATDGSAIISDMRYDMAAQFLGGVQMPDREAKLAKLRADIEAMAPEEFAVRNLYATRNLQVNELQAYVQAHENEAMGWLARNVGYGIKQIMLESMGRMISAILDVSAKKN